MSHINFSSAWIDEDEYEYDYTYSYSTSDNTSNPHWNFKDASDPYYCVKCGNDVEYGSRHRIACDSNESMRLGIFMAPTPETLANSALLQTKGWIRLWRYPEVVESLALLAVGESSWYVSLVGTLSIPLTTTTPLINTTATTYTTSSGTGSSLNLKTLNSTLTTTNTAT